jgi:two-component system cell cycle sensor histidine kinase/response regulator CckA
MNSPHNRGAETGQAAARRTRASALQKSEDTVLALLESASQAIVSVDRHGRIVLVNRRAEEMFGYTREELLSETMEILLPETARKPHENYREEYFARPRVRPMGIGMELAARRKDGTEFPVEVSLSYVETADGAFAIAFVTDISARKNLEEQLLHSQKMEAVGRLAGGIAHDFNNMLTIISGYNRMILEGLSPSDPLRGFAEQVLKAADRAGALTNQLLAFSRRQVIQPRVVDLNQVIMAAEQMLRRLIGEDLELVLRLAPGSMNIKVDPGHIDQAVFNLAVNARDAMPQGGRITIETAAVQLDHNYARTHLGVEPGEYVMLAVSDNGHGMDAETRRRIFEPFFTTKQKGKGTGLGLATVYGIVKQSGGDIWVYSEPGKGTTFKLYFRRVREATSSLEEGHARPQQQRGSETLLVVEDEEAVRDLVATMLRRQGYTVLTAADAHEAIRLAEEHRDALRMLLTDVIMPRMSGKELAMELLRTNPKLQVLYLSGYTENTILHHGVLDEDVNFLAKPFSQETLARKVRTILDSGPGAQASAR